MNKIIWHNKTIYDHDELLKIMHYIEKNMYGLLPLSSNEKNILEHYANKHHFSTDAIVSLRLMIRIQKEIISSRTFELNIDKIQNKFINLMKESSVNDDKSFNKKIGHFIKSTRMPVQLVIKTIGHTKEFKKLTDSNIKFIDNIQKTIHDNEIKIRQKSGAFEHLLEDHLLNNYDIHFRTEVDIKHDKDYQITPDILFDKPITLELDGKEYLIRWMDAKNYILADVPFVIKSLNKQAAKYYDVFGMGAFVFHYGIDASIKIKNTIILDGSTL